MKILIVNNAEPADSEFNKPLIEYVSRLSPCDVVNYRNVEIDNGIDGVILSGVPLHYDFNSVEQRQPYMQWIHGTDIPVLGICLGHQSIGKLFGATIVENKEAENGIRTMHITKDDPILRALPKNFQATTLHRASISLPDAFVLLANSGGCANEIMRHTRKRIYGLQFHPELSSSTEAILKNFIDIVREHHMQISKLDNTYSTTSSSR
jgi:GMP synthase (glutamine-hydrolysing)